MKIAISQSIIVDDKHALFLTDEDINEFNTAASCVEKSLTRDEILDFLSKDIHIYYRGKMWGFNDTEVREEICEELEKAS